MADEISKINVDGTEFDIVAIKSTGDEDGTNIKSNYAKTADIIDSSTSKIKVSLLPVYDGSVI